jgi:pimeloyl-ACP methyl ester carboxylesterase
LKKVYAIPGLGCTKDLFQNIRVPNHELVVLNWPQTKPSESLKAYAKKFLPQINTNEKVSLIGVSFGGMICSELIELIETDKVVLISSTKNKKQFPFLLKFLKVIPLYYFLTNYFFTTGGQLKRRLLGFDDYYSKLFTDMMSSMRPNYFRHAINTIVNWQRTENNPKIIQIHGTKDRLMPVSLINAKYIIKDGSHAMVLTRAEEINLILNEVFND